MGYGTGNEIVNTETADNGGYAQMAGEVRQRGLPVGAAMAGKGQQHEKNGPAVSDRINAKPTGGGRTGGPSGTKPSGTKLPGAPR